MQAHLSNLELSDLCYVTRATHQAVKELGRLRE